jgi:O-antigen/teichoic acid export membrane protein
MTILQVVGSNGLRLISNLILTRLLFPEAFGLMSLMQIFLYGLQTFSDIGINTMLIQHKQGGERRYLDTLWTLQILRGGVLWLLACAIAAPVAHIYDQPEILAILPVMALNLVIGGFKTTKEIEANRELILGRVVFLALTAQLIGLIAMASLAYWLQSVWALVFGTLISACVGVALMHAFLPGQNNRLRWDKAIVMETLRFGSFIFLSTICSFFIMQGTQMVLAGHIDIAVFGVYSIAVMLASLPGMVLNTIAQKVIFPLYRLKSPTVSPENQANLFRARRMVAMMGIGGTAVIAFVGVPVVNLLYDDRYALAGPIMVLLAAGTMPGLSIVGSQESLNGHGDSRRHFYFVFTRAILQMTIVYFAVSYYGILGAAFTGLIATLLTYPLRAYLVSRYNCWDPKGDACLAAAGVCLSLLALWTNRSHFVDLTPFITPG